MKDKQWINRKSVVLMVLQRWNSLIYLLGVSIVVTWTLLVSTGFGNVQVALKFLNDTQITTKRSSNRSNGDGHAVKGFPYTNDIKSLCNVSIHEGMNIMKMKIPSFAKRFRNPCWYENKTLRCLPYMYLVGVAKCGTTDLFKRITLHPDFVAPTIKEPNWLSSGRFYTKSRHQTSISYYASKFFSPLSRKLSSSKCTTLITGEASINTLEGSHFWNYLGINVGHGEPLENNAEYIHHLYRETKILINVRNPVDRLWSEYLAFSRSNVKSAFKFHEIVQREIQLYNGCQHSRTLRACMYDKTLDISATMSKQEQEAYNGTCPRKPVDIVKLRRGVYHVFIRDFLKVFPMERVLIQRLEDISNNRKGSLLRTYEFLGLEKPSEVNLQNILKLGVRNPRKTFNKKKGNMLNSTRQLLYEFYKPHNEALADLLHNADFNYGPKGG